MKEKILNVFRKSEKIRVSFYLSHSLIWYIAFLIVPISLTFLYSFWRMESMHLIPTWTLENYVKTFTYKDLMYIRLLIKSFLMSVAVTLGSVGLGYLIAYYLSMKVEKYKYPLLFLLMGPYLCSYILLVFSWGWIILGWNGIVNSLLINLGLISQPLEWLMHNLSTVIFILILSWAPWLVFPMFVSLEKMDKTLLEAAADLGANPRQAFLKVTLPLSTPGILVAVLFVFIPTIGEFVTPALVGGTEGMMYANFIEHLFQRGWNWPLGSALSFVMMIFTLIIVFIMLRKVSLEQIMESL